MGNEFLLALQLNFSEYLSPEAEAVVAAERLSAQLLEWLEGGEVELTDSIENLKEKARALAAGQEKSFLEGVLPAVQTNSTAPSARRARQALLWAHIDAAGALHIDGQDLGPGTEAVSDDGNMSGSIPSPLRICRACKALFKGTEKNVRSAKHAVKPSVGPCRPLPAE